MGVQNPYNNYLNRQSKKPTNDFRQKVMNSMSGKAVGNNSTQRRQPMNAPTGTPTVNQMNNQIPGANTQPKPKQVQPAPQVNPQVAPQGSTINSKPIQPVNNVNTPVQPQNVAQPNVAPQNPIPGAEGTGMMAVGDMREQMQTPEQTQLTPPTAQEMQQINEMAQDPMIRQQAYEQKKTPQEIAKELLEEQKKQAQADWEQKKAELENSMNQATGSFEQSKNDANNIYKETEQTLNDSRYQQQQDLAVSGSNRGIQYSPQQLGLEQVANINHNKNLAEASNKRNELLNKLTIEANNALANINLGLQGATNEYNKALAEMNASYQKQMMDWEWDDQKTKEEREWQEKQAQADKDFQKEMAEMQNKWQEAQNALDRDKYGKSRGGGGGYSYGGGRRYSGYKGRSKSAWENWGSSYNGNSYGNNIADDDIEGQMAMQNVLEEGSTDMFNVLKHGTTDSLNDRASFYRDEMKNMSSQLASSGMNKDGQKRAEDVYNTAMEKMFQRNEFNTYGKPYKMSGNNSDTTLQSKVHKPYKPTLEQIKKRSTAKQDFNAEFSTDGKKKAMAMLMGTNKDRKPSKKTVGNNYVPSNGAKNKPKTSPSKAKVGSNKDFVYKPKKAPHQKPKTNKDVKKSKYVKKVVKDTQKVHKAFKNPVKTIANTVKKMFKKKKR